MNRAELIKEVAAATGQTSSEATKSVDAVINAIKKGVTESGETKLLGFGSFKSQVRAARVGRNPSTGLPIEIPEKTVVKFKPYF